MTKTTKHSAAKAAEEKTEKLSNLIRVLSSVCLINSAKFIDLSADRQTKTLSETGGKPVRFVPSFTIFQDKKKLRDDLLLGKDVSIELEFNGIELSEAERATLVAINPILIKIEAIGPNYPWYPEYDGKGIIFETNRIRRNGHFSAKNVAKKIWDRASKYWSGGPLPVDHREYFNGSGGWNGTGTNQSVSYKINSVVVGCQTITRAELEYIARHYKWKPVIFEG